MAERAATVPDRAATAPDRAGERVAALDARPDSAVAMVSGMAREGDNAALHGELNQA
jgi:hypothetical protein